MLQIIARITQGTEVVGYQLTDGSMTQSVSKGEAWTYAKNKMISNVVGTGTEDSPVLSGINGFELKKLPTIPYNQTQREYKAQDYYAAHARAIIQGDAEALSMIDDIHREEYKNILKAYLKRDVEQRGIQITNDMSPYIKVINTLYDSEKLKNHIVMDMISVIDKIVEKANMLKPEKVTINKIKSMDSAVITDICIQVLTISNQCAHLKETTNIDKKQKDILGDFCLVISSTFSVPDNEINMEELLNIKNMLLKTFINLDTKGAGFITPSHIISDILGYRIQYTGNKPLIITRMTSTPEHSTKQVQIKPNEIICLNRAELVLLASNPSINWVLANGKMVQSSRRNHKTMYSYFNSIYFKFNAAEDSHAHATDTIRSIYNYVDEKIFATYFMGYPDSVADKHNIALLNKSQEKHNQSTGLLDMFKR